TVVGSAGRTASTAWRAALSISAINDGVENTSSPPEPTLLASSDASTVAEASPTRPMVRLMCGGSRGLRATTVRQRLLPDRRAAGGFGRRRGPGARLPNRLAF